MGSYKHKKRDKKSQPGWHGRVWLASQEGTFIGFGRAVLLERIKEHGSINKAAKSMEMSYKHAWDLLKSMQRQAGADVVSTSRGGAGGGGAKLTKAGEEMLAYFWQSQQRFENFLKEETQKWQEWQNQKT